MVEIVAQGASEECFSVFFVTGVLFPEYEGGLLGHANASGEVVTEDSS